MFRLSRKLVESLYFKIIVLLSFRKIHCDSKHVLCVCLVSQFTMYVAESDDLSWFCKSYKVSMTRFLEIKWVSVILTSYCNTKHRLYVFYIWCHISIVSAGNINLFLNGLAAFIHSRGWRFISSDLNQTIHVLALCFEFVLRN